MSEQMLIINGEDFSSYLAAEDGYQITEYDMDGPEAGETMAGTMIRDRIGSKEKGQFKCRALREDEAKKLLNAIHPEYVWVSWMSPRLGMRKSFRCYSNNKPATYLFRKADGTIWWSSISFPLIEVECHA